MPFVRTAHRPLLALGIVAALLVVAGTTVAWRAGRAVATSDVAAAQAAVALAEPTTTTAPPPPTTAPSTTSTTPTTRPKPVVTTAPPTTAARRPPVTTATTLPPSPAFVPPTVAPTKTTSAEERCAAARQWAAEHGLPLPAGWGFRCPSKAVVEGVEKWGLACWNCEGTGSWIAIDIGRIGASDQTLRYVVAHEICHAVEYTTLGLSTELTADLCAAGHGAPRP